MSNPTDDDTLKISYLALDVYLFKRVKAYVTYWTDYIVNPAFNNLIRSRSVNKTIIIKYYVQFK